MKLLLSMVQTDCGHSRLALKSLYTVVAEAPIEVDVREFRREEDPQRIYEQLIREKYNLLYFHVNMFNETETLRICELVKKAVPSCIVMVGGMEVSFDTRTFLRENPEIDYVFRGEGEPVLYEFVRTLLSYRFDFAHIPGLAYREGDEILVNKLGEPMRYEDIPFAYTHFEVEPDSVVYYESTRGTPDQCDYAQFLPDRRIRSLSLGRVARELRYFLVKEAREVVFLDKWFNYQRERAYQIWAYLISNDNGKTGFSFDVNGDLLDEETIALLAEARKGLFTFHIDIESTNAVALASVGRKENIYQLMYNVTKLLQAGTVRVCVTQRAGLPGDTPELFERAFNKIYNLHADEFNIEILRLRRGTMLRQEAEKYGYVYNRTAPYEIIASDYLPAAALIDIRAMAATYQCYAHGFETATARVLSDLGIKPYALYAGLMQFIREGNLARKLEKPENRYRVFYTYATGLYDAHNETLKLQILMEVLHHDMEENVPPEVIRKLERKGWEIHVAGR